MEAFLYIVLLEIKIRAYVPSYHPINNESIPFQSCWYGLSSTRPQFPPIFQKMKSHEKLTCSFVLSTTSGRDMQWHAWDSLLGLGEGGFSWSG